mgnify:CR=1 FL=1
MTSDSTPVFALEKEALKTEIETGLQVGVDHLEDKPMKRKPVEKYHNTRYLLKQYRKVAYAIQISESDMNVRMEMEHGTRLSTLEVNAELAGVDLSGSKLEGYWCSGIGSYRSLIPGAAKARSLSVDGCTASEPQRIIDALAEGKLVVALMTKGHFTSSCHFIVLRGCTSDGKILVADPSSYKRSEKSLDMSIILNEASNLAGYGGPFWIIGN